MSHPVRVLVVDDSEPMRRLVVQGLHADPAITVVGAASSADEARSKVALLRPQVITFGGDDASSMDGVSFLGSLMPDMPTPVVMLTPITGRGPEYALRMFEAGAVDIVARPANEPASAVNGMLRELCSKVKRAAVTTIHMGGSGPQRAASRRPSSAAPVVALDDPAELATPRPRPLPLLIAVGASTGGPDAIRTVLKGLTRTTPGILVVQHMPPNFTRTYAQRLNDDCPQTCTEARDGDTVLPGHVYVAPGSQHMTVERVAGKFVVRCQRGPRVAGHCPSVDVLFRSVAEHAGAAAIGILLTGMGRDGAEGLLEMRRAGAFTLAQDEESSVVYGMPQEAHALGAAERMVHLEDFASIITRRMMRPTT